MITLEAITKQYGDQTILKSIDYRFRDTGITCILGASGSGKSTLLNLLAGFDTKYDGTITVCNEKITTMNPVELCQFRQQHIGFVFQSYNLISGYTVVENIMLAAELNGKPAEENLEKVSALLAKLGIETKAEEKVENLSGGQRQRVAIARALVNDPQILFADEPTGALDRELSNQIMDILKEISMDRLVVVITHDTKVCAWADEVISIVEGKIEVVSSEEATTTPSQAQAHTESQQRHDRAKVSIWKRAVRNFRVHLLRYLTVSVVIAIGISLFVVSLSSNNIMSKSITDFIEKNTAFNNGYIAIDKNQDPSTRLSEDPRIDNIYHQYVLQDLSLAFDEEVVSFNEKIPMPKATENMSYGIMPRSGKNEISITPSVGKKFTNNIHELIGQKLTLEYEGESHLLTISGIYNAGYDDFFISSDVEQSMYKHVGEEKPRSVSYDVINFSDIVSVTEGLTKQHISTKTAVEQVAALENTFNNLKKLFMVVSILILSIALFLSSVLLAKQTNARYREIGVLAALGYNKRWIRGILSAENILLSCTATVFSMGMFFAIHYVYSLLLGGDLIIRISQVVITVISTFIIILLLSTIVSRKLIATEPAEALRK
ncbi:ABC transporter ATP-binding protein/permease [Paenibacillus macquariensis]|uniref:ABC-type lipoprotein export system, ATPase component n=1 Tax=Paenibacillus macquariensis TaxID=948756 RepID=A0ABY1KAH1_9BACL|nr:ABC transporter ATP-binding protein/permease [Paenibacillus macquariensis]MEC0093682.1 ABC transporter ATP-binding protein/permease [Paenibacillus macquariensis]OAB31634.1 ABC transporter [Paenibacillus macquariensis subsp. macquariensis]SIR50978.1 ABC-type lipoprotein export system, ATPase component [Paenibacillus macquariensis]